jgi:ComF family protein
VVRGFLEFLIDLVSPALCVHCGSVLLEPPSLDGLSIPAGWPDRTVSFLRAVGGHRVLCRDCWLRLEPAFECSGPETGGRRAGGIGFVSPFFTNEVLLSLVRFFKFGGGTPVAESLSWWMARALQHCCPVPSAERIIVPVPLHRRREQARGYNQAALLARGVAADLGHRFCERVLVRRRRTKSQARLGDEDRARNVRNAFLLTRAASIAGKEIVVVDDLVTSGQTAYWCAQALFAGAPDRVVVLSAGRRRE